MEGNRLRRGLGASLAVGLVWLLLAAPAVAQPRGEPSSEVQENDLVQLDFDDVELAVVIDTIARLTSKNFIYDDRVRGRVTIVSPTKITVDQAYAVFESVLQVKGFTTVQGPGGAIKIIPIRDAKEQSIETVQGRRKVPVSDRFITRLIPLRFIDAEAITNTLKPLVAKDASMVAYPPTNTVILTDSATNIQRILDILQSIDIETYKEQLAVLKVHHADAATLGQQLSEIYGGEVTGANQAPVRGRTAAARRAQQAALTDAADRQPIRIITDARTNSLIVLASRQKLTDIRETVRKLDVPVTGGGRIHVYYLKNADAEELAQTLSTLVGGQPAAPTGGAARGQQATPQALRAAITELAEGVSITADPGTNSLVIQASQEGFATISTVIAALDIPRPQVLVEALIMEVDIANNEDLGFNGLARVFRGNTSYGLGSLTDTLEGGGRPPVFETPGAMGAGGTPPGTTSNDLLTDLIASAARSTVAAKMMPNPAFISSTLTPLVAPFIPATDAFGNPVLSGSLIQGIIRASSGEGATNIVSAPHILTTDNEEAEIKVGAEIPIITNRVQSAAGIDTATNDLATSVNVERQDIGVTLRVTPQISEGDNVRLKIFQEITDVNDTLSAQTGDPTEVGVSLTKRNVENTVVVSDGETVVIGGLISDDYEDTVNKVPWLGDIPILGWLFKTTGRRLTKTNLLIFLTPHIVRTAEDLEQETIRKREEFRERSAEAVDLSEKEKEEHEDKRRRAEEAGLDVPREQGRFPVRGHLNSHEKRYPVERMRDIERLDEERRSRAAAEAEAGRNGPRYAVMAAVFRNELAASEMLMELVDAGYDGTLVSGEQDGTVLFELRLGPYATLEEAERIAEVVRNSHGLDPSVLVERNE